MARVTGVNIHNIGNHHDRTSKWLMKHGLSPIIQNCLQHEMTLDVFMEADLHDLKELCKEAGIKTQYRLKLQSVLKRSRYSSLSSMSVCKRAPYTIERNDDEKIEQSSTRRIDHKFKVAIIGDSGVGKSSMVLRFTENFYTASFVSTIGVDFKSKTVRVDNKRIQLQIWDTAGQERFFQTILTSCYRGTHAIIMVFDITVQRSFAHLTKWIENITNWAPDDVLVFLVGTKVDLEAQRVVEFEEGNEFAIAKGYKYCEVSAKSGHNIRQLFNSVALYCLMQCPLSDLNASKSFQLIACDGDKERKKGTQCCFY